MSVRLTQQDRRNAALIQIEGNLDLTAVASFRQQISPMIAGRPTVVFDLTNVASVDSSGLSAIVALRDATEAIFLYNPNPRVERLLTLTNLTNYFTILDGARLETEFPVA